MNRKNLAYSEVAELSAQLRTHIFELALRQAFSRKKNFENPSKFDQVRGKNVNCTPIFQQIPPPLLINKQDDIFVENIKRRC